MHRYNVSLAAIGLLALAACPATQGASQSASTPAGPSDDDVFKPRSQRHATALTEVMGVSQPDETKRNAAACNWGYASGGVDGTEVGLYVIDQAMAGFCHDVGESCFGRRLKPPSPGRRFTDDFLKMSVSAAQMGAGEAPKVAFRAGYNAGYVDSFNETISTRLEPSLKSACGLFQKDPAECDRLVAAFFQRREMTVESTLLP
jgi:hypothetical protein